MKLLIDNVTRGKVLSDSQLKESDSLLNTQFVPV